MFHVRFGASIGIFHSSIQPPPFPSWITTGNIFWKENGLQKRTLSIRFVAAGTQNLESFQLLGASPPHLQPSTRSPHPLQPNWLEIWKITTKKSLQSFCCSERRPKSLAHRLQLLHTTLHNDVQKESTRIHGATDDTVLSRFCGSATT